MNTPKITKISILHLPMISPDTFEIMVNRINHDVNRHKVIVQVLQKNYTLERNTIRAKLPIKTPAYTHPLQAQLKGNNSLRVKAFIYDLETEKIVEARLQEFGMPMPKPTFTASPTGKMADNENFPTVLEYKPNDDLLRTVPTIVGNWEVPKKEETVYKLTSLDYVCVNDAYKHQKGTTYFDLDKNKIILNDNYRPYAFVGIGTPQHKGQLAIIENIETGQLFYPKSTDENYTIDKKGYAGYDAYGKLRIPFEGFKTSLNEGVKVYANEECEYFVNDKSIGKFTSCRSCSGLPNLIEHKEKEVFTINKKTFQLPLPKDLIVTASDSNEIKEGMPILINNDRSINRQDKEDQQFENNKLPTKNAEEIFKEIATLWNNYQNDIYKEYLTPSLTPALGFNEEKSKLDYKKLLIPNLIKDGTLPNISEKFIKDFFENKIKGYFNSIDDLYSLYEGENRKIYEKAGSDLVNNFFTKKGTSYYKTKVIAEAIYKTESGKESINNMLKLIDQIFQYQLTKPKDKINDKDFLETPLDNAWFDKGIDPQTFPSYTIKSLAKTNEDRFALFCIGGTQKAKATVKSFTPIYDKDKIGYDATIILQYGDYFGVSESDYTKDLKLAELTNLTEFNYRGGVMAQWILQHQYGYQPFNDYLNYQVKMKRIWEK